jgi:CRP-like cAMP-binding protein
MPANVLTGVNPFHFLAPERCQTLARSLSSRRLSAGELVAAAGERGRELGVLAEGSLEAFDPRDPARVLHVITAGHYFGEQAALFEQSPDLSPRARGAALVYHLPQEELSTLVDSEPAFALALAHALVQKHGIFAPYRRMFAQLMALLDRRAFLLSELVPAYRRLMPALHPQLADERIDVGALAYAVARLPESVTHTTFYYLCSVLPEIYREPDRMFDVVRTAARRRSAWQPVPGKLVVLLRDGVSDVTDLLTCLCLYSVEAEKLRRRLRSNALLVELRTLERNGDDGDAEALLGSLPLAPDELAGLKRIWPRDLAWQLRNILLHHEDVGIECDLVGLDYNASAGERWVAEIRRLARDVIELDDPDLEVHLISSNTHSIGNCLSPYIGRREEELLAWGRAHRPELCDADWHQRRDLVYLLAREHELAHPEARGERVAAERAAGHYRLSHSA